jgi:MFS family permease
MPARGSWPLVAGVIGVAAFLTTIDGTIVNVALPSIQRDLGMSLPQLQWAVTGYLLTFSALMLTGGRLADRYGARPVLLAGLALFTGVSLPAGLAPGAAVLLAARAAQGAGAALVLPAGLAVVAAGRTARQRDAGAAVWMAALAAALATGPVAGGWLAQHLGWHWIFLVNIPVGLAGMALGWLGLPGPAPHGAAAPHDAAGLANAAGLADAAGPLGLSSLACCTVLLGGVTYVLIEGPGQGFGSPVVIAAAGLACAAAAGLRRAERRAPAPLIDTGLVRQRVLGGSLAASVLWGAGVNGVLFYTSLFLQRAAGFSATRTGLVFAPLAVLVVLVTPATPYLTGRFGAARTAAAGLAAVAAGLAAIAMVRHQVTVPRLLPGLALIGTGSALTVPLTSAALAAVPPNRTGVAGGLIAAAREASGLAGIAVLGLVVTAAHPVPPHGRLGAGFADGYGAGLLTAAALALVAAVIAARTLPGPAAPAAAKAQPAQAPAGRGADGRDPALHP